MRTLFVLLSGLWFAAPVFAGGAVVELEIKKMACPLCARTVGERLAGLPGVENVKISLKTDTARVIMAPGRKPDVAQMREVIADAGFEAGAVTVTEQEDRRQ